MASEARHVWIPRVGDHIRLEEPWSFTLNMNGGKQQLSPAWVDILRDEGLRANHKAEFSEATVLRVELVSLRNSARDRSKADSVTFTVLKATTGDAYAQGSRIWTRLGDVNEMYAAQLDAREVKRVKAALKRKTTKKLADKLYADDVRAAIFPTDPGSSPWDIPAILSKVGKWLVPQMQAIPAVANGQKSCEDIFVELLSPDHAKSWKLVHRKTHTFRHPTIRSLVFSPKSPKFDGLFGPIESKCNEQGVPFTDTFHLWVESDPRDKKLTRVCVQFNEHYKNRSFGRPGRGSNFARESYRKFIIREHTWSAPIRASK